MRVTTIPRLELLGVLICVRLARFICSQLLFLEPCAVVRTDSMCVLHWIRNSTKAHPVFVENRLQEITAPSPVAITFRYVPTSDNPADLASRGISAQEAASATLWWNGPPWLSQASNTWPCQPESNPTQDVPPEEPAACSALPITSTCAAVLSHPPFGIDSSTHSSLHKLIHVTAWCARFIFNCRRPVGAHCVGTLS